MVRTDDVIDRFSKLAIDVGTVEELDWYGSNSVSATVSRIDIDRLLYQGLQLRFFPILDARIRVEGIPWMGLIVAHRAHAASDFLIEVSRARDLPRGHGYVNFVVELDRGVISVVAASFCLHLLRAMPVDPADIAAIKAYQSENRT
jgi:hypothetical protein